VIGSKRNTMRTIQQTLSSEVQEVKHSGGQLAPLASPVRWGHSLASLHYIVTLEWGDWPMLGRAQVASRDS
jgi:hypothetical protein